MADKSPDYYTAEARNNRTKKRRQNRKNRIVKMLEEQNGVCYICGRTMQENEITVDHVIPRAKGGTDSVQNLKLAHERCNHAKDDKLIGESWLFNYHRN
jgi:5-methylcytosine-specific restriction endonuclease McrA